MIVRLEDGTEIRQPRTAGIDIENYPARSTPAHRYERTREYPPEYRRFTTLRATVLSAGMRVRHGRGSALVTSVELEDSEK